MRKFCIIREADNSKINPLDIPKICTPGSQSTLTPNDLVIKDAEYIVRSPYRFLGLVDRAKSKLEWWSYDISLLKIFNRLEDAIRVKQKLHYGELHIVEFEVATQLLPYWHYSIKDEDGKIHEYKIGVDLASGKDWSATISIEDGKEKHIPTWML